MLMLFWFCGIGLLDLMRLTFVLMSFLLRRRGWSCLIASTAGDENQERKYREVCDLFFHFIPSPMAFSKAA